VTHLHLTPLGGIAGDMFAAALLHALPRLQDPVLAEVAKVLPEDHPPCRLLPCETSGLTALRFDVPAHPVRVPVHYPEMAAMLDGRAHAAGILRLLAEAEAQVHGVPLEKVHFHEIADWDTLADVTAAGAILDALDGAGWSMDPLPLGGGTVKTRHGVMPVPAPATAALLSGLPVADDGLPGERVTPTGAAIARYVHGLGLSPRPAGVLQATGRGAGTRQLPDRPNVLAVQVIGAGAAEETLTETVTSLGFEIDDMTGEELAAAAETLRALPGVLDVMLHPVQGKKSRPATALRLLLRPDALDTVAEACFRHTSTLGLRHREETRRILPRAAGAHAGIRWKEARRPGGLATRKAESDDLSAAGSLDERRRLARGAEEDR
jgi:hypothetical protein